MREIILDTETTGLSPQAGHRIVEIGCLELVNHVPSGRFFHSYVNPERDMPSAALAIHGLTDEFLGDKPRFADIADDFLNFVEDTPLVIHNAEFDLAFLNAELARLERPTLVLERAIDTLSLARRRFPGAPASLDALCKRFSVDNSNRTKHGALLDAELLAEVYLELLGGRQPGLGLVAEGSQLSVAMGQQASRMQSLQRSGPRPVLLSKEEEKAHAAFLATLQGDILWRSFDA
jgi:DNA polymerase-3 subunit epsilon